ncbi:MULTISPECIES: GNAT family N-acetyltransferase [Streptomyces]|uniref:Acetyltransferase n=1 Tax=Streptomyces virginiae TaxID=1961 RepID=A0ABQ3NIS0_STRVG|nr:MULTISPECIES: GNAT family N-acetyltransferase [Streptomyces]GLV95237.1 acetyltransferase [Streptomyces lavendulae subsp. lavendulae]KOU99054.1 transcriptional regulator [Streptomyces sp. XY533]KOV10422.1 transcriptional regulator [Streptomyces sp. XY511]MBP2343441.1 GNAT superfamily N-acetyltransferase [Streptomyces virginiae]MCI4080845.1 GNAT family N-acetyltransferase [Streptomyces sp. MMS21 TC-5]
MIFRVATRRDLPAVLALLADEDRVLDPAPTTVGEEHERAFAAIASDARNELLVLTDGAGSSQAGEGPEADEVVLGCLQLTYIPGLGQGGRDRALVEAVRVRADRRGEGLGAELMRLAAERARGRGCGLIQLTSNKRRTAAHRFYERLGFARSHEGFKLPLDRP